MAGQVILSAAYEIDVLPLGDPFVEDAENMLRAMAFASTKAASLFDTITWRIYYYFSKSLIDCLTDAFARWQ
jgi:hypothetical protein